MYVQIFGITSAASARPSGIDGFILINPIDIATRMLMLVFANGSLTRQYVRDAMCTTWTQYNTYVDATPVGNDGCMGFYYMEHEITPTTHHSGCVRFDACDRIITSFDEKQHDAFTPADCRAVLEWQVRCDWHTHVTGLSHAHSCMWCVMCSPLFHVIPCL